MTDITVSSLGATAGRRILPDRALPDRALSGRVLFWAACPVLAVQALAVPPFLLLAIAFAAAFLVLAAQRRLTVGRRVVPSRRSPSSRLGSAGREVAGMVAAGVCGLLALRIVVALDGAALADAWPVLVPTLSALTGLPLADPAPGTGRILIAVALALGGLLCWSAAFRRGRAGDCVAPLCLRYGLAALACCLLHLCLEPRLSHEAPALLAAAAIGIGPLTLARILRPAAD